MSSHGSLQPPQVVIDTVVSPTTSPVPSPAASPSAHPFRPSESMQDIQLKDEEKKTMIRRINSDQNLTMPQKMAKIQEIMMQGVRMALSPMHRDTVPDAERTVSFHNAEKKELGCAHYSRGCKIRAPCCKKIFPCRLCHNENSDHEINRFQIAEMMCMYCFQLQPVAQSCRNPECLKSMARYYCGVCKLFDDFPDRKIFHCHSCGICRRGSQEDFFHCNKCNICLHKSQQNSHTCIERSLESNCPVCAEWLFTSIIPVHFMRCGHPIHVPCFENYCKTNWVCPLCNKSLHSPDAMAQYYRLMEHDRIRQPMPAAFCKWRANVLCNDCLATTNCPYHFLYNKCGTCNGYNTKLVSTIKVEASPEAQLEHETQSQLAIQNLNGLSVIPEDNNANGDNMEQDSEDDDDDEALNAENAVSILPGSPAPPVPRPPQNGPSSSSNSSPT